MAGKHLPRYVSSIQCPVDLDSLIMPSAPMSTEPTPQSIEENLNVGDDIFWDAIGTSTLSSWLLKLDVMEQFSKEMRRKIFWALPNFSRMSRVYFYIQLMNTDNHEDIKNELHDWESENPHETQRDSNISMINPMNMLSNNLKEWDKKILNGELTLRRFLLDRIKAFLDSGNKDEVDFSHSLFLPELLSPKFFNSLSEAENIVILGNMDKYFRYVEKFNKTGLTRGTYSPGHELNPPQVLIKHILSGDFPYTNRVKMIAWKKIFSEISTLYNAFTTKTGAFKILSVDYSRKILAEVKERAKDVSLADMEKWLVESEGVFEAFELDCTLHNLDASDFFLPILCSRDFYKIAEGLIDFQDDATRDKLFKQLSEVMISYR